MPIYKSLKAFTLTELVIVITILAILSTIGFVSYSNNISTTRDNKRKLDIKNIQIALSEYKKENGNYPLPGAYFNLTLSGQVVAKQGLLNRDVRLSTLASIPNDPLDEHFYSYGVTPDQKQYQLAVTLENDGDEKILLKGDYQSVAKRMLPNILLATSTGAGINIDIGSGTLDGDANRKLFLFNQGDNNIIYSLEGGGNSISNGEELQNLLTQSEEIDYWQKHDYESCNEIFQAGKSIGAGQYQIMNDSGTLIDTYCSMTNTCSSSQHPAGGICVGNTRSCNSLHGAGIQIWSFGTNQWLPDPCIATSCDPGYGLISGVCMVICIAGGETPCVVQ